MIANVKKVKMKKKLKLNNQQNLMVCNYQKSYICNTKGI